jgi:hypothetical protein
MVEPGLVKIGGTSLFSTAFLPTAILIVGGIIVWKIWESHLQEIRIQKAADSKYKETLATFKTEIDVLTTEQRELSTQMTQLQEKLSAFKKAKAINSVKNTPFNTLIHNEASNSTTEPAKLAMFQLIIEDNVELRKTI